MNTHMSPSSLSSPSSNYLSPLPPLSLSPSSPSLYLSPSPSSLFPLPLLPLSSSLSAAARALGFTKRGGGGCRRGRRRRYGRGEIERERNLTAVRGRRAGMAVWGRAQGRSPAKPSGSKSSSLTTS